MTEFNLLQLSEQQPGWCEFTTDAGLLLRIEASALGVFRVRIGEATKLDDTKLNPRAKARQSLLLARTEILSEFDVDSFEQGWRLTQSNTAVEVGRSPFSLRFYQDGQLVLSVGEFAQTTSQDSSSLSLTLAIKADESVYGLGRSDCFDRRGQRIVSDEHVENFFPLAWSAKGWGMFVHSLHRMIHEIALSRKEPNYHVEVVDGVLDIFFYIGNPVDIFNQFSATTGRPGQPPLNSMGIWLDQCQGQSLDEMGQIVDELGEAGFAADTFNLSPPSLFAFANDKLGLDWDETRVGDVRHFTKERLKGARHLCLPAFPGIPVDTLLFRDLEDRAWLLLDDDNQAYILDTPAGKVGLLDLTHKDAYQFWQSRLQQLLDNTDTGLSIAYPITIPDGVNARYGDTGAFLRQQYPLWLEQSLFDAQAFDKTPSEAYVRRSSLSLNSPRSMGMYIQQSVSGFEHLGQLLQNHLSVQASGVIAQSHVIRFASRDKRLYLRLLALSVFCPGFSFMADKSSLPMAFDGKTQEIAKVFWDLRYRLIPYVLGAIEDATRTGLPVQRIMALAFPQDEWAHQYHQQYLLGPALLVAPILDDTDRKSIYLPAGDAWWDLNTGIRYEGGQVLDYQCEIDTIPVFGREGHMLCLGPVLNGLTDFNSARILEEVWLFGMPLHNPVVMRNKIRVMQMQGSSYIRGFEGLKILSSEGLEVKRRGAEVRISKER